MICKAAKLSGVGLHACRHTYASLLIRQGESLKYISKQLGHSSIQMTADIYGHLFKETSTKAMRQLNKLIPVEKQAEKPTRRLRIVAPQPSHLTPSNRTSRKGREWQETGKNRKAG